MRFTATNQEINVSLEESRKLKRDALKAFEEDNFEKAIMLFRAVLEKYKFIYNFLLEQMESLEGISLSDTEETTRLINHFKVNNINEFERRSGTILEDAEKALGDGDLAIALSKFKKLINRYENILLEIQKRARDRDNLSAQSLSQSINQSDRDFSFNASRETKLHFFYRHFIHTATSDILFLDRLSERYPLLNPLRNFAGGVRFFTSKPWPIAFLGLLIHDFIVYSQNDLSNYGVTILQIFGGTADSQQILTNYLGSDLPTELFYWLGPVIITGSALLAGFVSLFQKRKNESNNIDAKSIVERYLQWTNGARIPHKIDEILFLGAAFISLYGEAQLYRILIQKLIGVDKYRALKKQCESLNMQLVYSNELQNYICVICPWEFVPWWKRAMSQACLDGLLDVPRDPEYILEKMKLIIQHPEIRVIDGSQQNFEAWTQVQFSRFIDLLKNATSSLDKFSMASRYEKPSITHDHRIPKLAEFFRIIPTKLIVLTNAGLGTENTRILSPALTSAEEIMYSGNKLTDEGGLIAVGNLNNKTKKVIFERNYFTNQGIQLITSIMPKSVKEYYFGGNKFSNAGLQSLGECGRRNNATVISVKDNGNLANANYTAFFEKLVGSQLLVFDGSRVGLGDDQMKEIAPFLALLNLREFIAHQNPIQNEGFVAFLWGAVNSTLLRVGFKEIEVDDDGVTFSSEIIQKTGIRQFTASSTRTTWRGWQKFLHQFARNNHAELFDLSDNPNLGDQFLLASKEDLVKIFRVYLNNINAEDEGTTRLLNETNSEKRIRDLSLKRNQITEKTVSFNYEGNSSLWRINIGGNLFEKNLGLSKLIGNPFFQNLKSIIFSNNPGIGDYELEKVANDLIGNMPENAKVPFYDRDQIRWFQKHAKPKTQIRELIADNDQLSEAMHNVFSLISPRLKLNFTAKNATSIALMSVGMFSTKSFSRPNTLVIRDMNQMLYELDFSIGTSIGLVAILMLSILIYKILKSINREEKTMPVFLNKGMNHA